MKTVVITGAGRGIGLALTKEFLAHGFQVVGTYRDKKSASGLLNLAQEQKNLFPVVADVSDENTFTELKEKCKNIGKIDIVINNSGVIGTKSSSMMDIDLDSIKEVFDVNTFGPLRIAQQLIPLMDNDGTVAQISSLMGSISDTSGGYYDYRMSKAALNMFNKCLSNEFPNLTCLVLHPGWVQSDMGGAGATVTLQDCAQGLFKVISNANKSESGKFIDYQGKNLPW